MPVQIVISNDSSKEIVVLPHVLSGHAPIHARYSKRKRSTMSEGGASGHYTNCPQGPPIGKKDTAMEIAISTMMIHSSTSMRRVVARFDILL